MTIDLSTVQFVNDVFTVEAEDVKSTLILYRVDEDFKSETAEEETVVKQILVALVDSEGVQHKATSIIGLTVNGFSIKSNIEELQGKPLTEDNMAYCSIVIGEE